MLIVLLLLLLIFCCSIFDIGSVLGGALTPEDKAATYILRRTNDAKPGKFSKHHPGVYKPMGRELNGLPIWYKSEGEPRYLFANTDKRWVLGDEEADFKTNSGYIFAKRSEADLPPDQVKSWVDNLQKHEQPFKFDRVTSPPPVDETIYDYEFNKTKTGQKIGIHFEGSRITGVDPGSLAEALNLPVGGRIVQFGEVLIPEDARLRDIGTAARDEWANKPVPHKLIVKILEKTRPVTPPPVIPNMVYDVTNTTTRLNGPYYITENIVNGYPVWHRDKLVDGRMFSRYLFTQDGHWVINDEIDDEDYMVRSKDIHNGKPPSDSGRWEGHSGVQNGIKILIGAMPPIYQLIPTGPDPTNVDNSLGTYNPTQMLANSHPVWEKERSDDGVIRYLFSTPSGQWGLGDEIADFTTGDAWLMSVDKHVGRMPNEIDAWEASVDDHMVVQNVKFIRADIPTEIIETELPNGLIVQLNIPSGPLEEFNKKPAIVVGYQDRKNILVQVGPAADERNISVPIEIVTPVTLSEITPFIQSRIDELEGNIPAQRFWQGFLESRVDTPEILAFWQGRQPVVKSYRPLFDSNTPDIMIYQAARYYFTNSYVLPMTLYAVAVVGISTNHNVYIYNLPRDEIYQLMPTGEVVATTSARIYEKGDYLLKNARYLMDIPPNPSLTPHLRTSPIQQIATAVRTQRPSVVRMDAPPIILPPSDPIAGILYRAMKGFGTTDDGVMTELDKVQSNDHWKAVLQSFRTNHSDLLGGNLIAAMFDELAVGEMDQAIDILAAKGVNIPRRINVGDNVFIGAGAESNQGDIGIVLNYERKGNYTVKPSTGDPVIIKDENLLGIDFTPIAVGSTVGAHGLVRLARLNGLKGEVTRYGPHEGEQKFIVILSTGEELAFRPKNLIHLQP